MMGGDMATMRNPFRPAAEKQAKINLTLNAIVEAEGLTVSEEEIAAEIENLAKQYELEVEKVKSIVPNAEIEENLKTRKAVKIIVDNAVAVATKAE
jgi:trigger factor